MRNVRLVAILGVVVVLLGAVLYLETPQRQGGMLQHVCSQPSAGPTPCAVTGPYRVGDALRFNMSTRLPGDGQSSYSIQSRVFGLYLNQSQTFSVFFNSTSLLNFSVSFVATSNSSQRAFRVAYSTQLDDRAILAAQEPLSGFNVRFTAPASGFVLLDFTVTQPLPDARVRLILASPAH